MSALKFTQVILTRLDRTLRTLCLSMAKLRSARTRSCHWMLLMLLSTLSPATTSLSVYGSYQPLSECGKSELPQWRKNPIVSSRRQASTKSSFASLSISMHPWLSHLRHRSEWPSTKLSLVNLFVVLSQARSPQRCASQTIWGTWSPPQIMVWYSCGGCPNAWHSACSLSRMKVSDSSKLSSVHLQ